MELSNLLKTLSSLSQLPTKPKMMRSNDFKIGRSTLTSWIVSHDSFFKSPSLPIQSRGFFTRNTPEPAICIRGYDKFFHIGEKELSWESLSKTLQGPFTVNVKENGCLILASAVDGTLLVTSKHSIQQHAEMGRKWILKHLAAKSKTELALVDFLQKHNITAVFELVDPDFEEHVISYPSEQHGLCKITFDV